MKIGRFTIEQLSEGRFEAFNDGKFNRIAPWDTEELPPEELRSKHSSIVGIDPILVYDDRHYILLDCGLGWGLDYGSAYRDVSNVRSNLDIFGIKPDQITHVILTHLHYDHSAGSTFTSPNATTVPTFPNALYYLQKREWEHAVSQVNQEKSLNGAGYKLDDFYRLVADNRIVLLDDDFHELIPGIKILWTGGHTPGHQVVRIHDQQKSAYYLGDLLPGDNHLNRYAMRLMDIHPAQARKMKIQLMRKMCEENALILFYHSIYSKAGLLRKDEQKRYVLEEI